ncbi:MAG: hypothetical protein J0M07_21515, partial [Anaerolineae bacterium]|nr:hypothetical protein [Anaerolineae bacterium]
MNEALKYHAVAELRALSLEELRALWELVPTERQRVHRAAYDREVRAAGGEGSDAKERQIALALLKRYHAAALVPIGLRWARAPRRVQSAAQQGAGFSVPEAETAAKPGRPSGKVIAVLGALMLLMVALLVLRGGGASGTAEATDVFFTATAPS